MDRFHEYTNILDILHDGVYMRMFAQTLEGECKKWLVDFPAYSIASFCDFHDLFLIRWVADIQETSLFNLHMLGQHEVNNPSKDITNQHEGEPHIMKEESVE